MNVNIYEHGTNWLLETTLPESLFSALESGVNSSVDTFHPDKENYTCKGPLVQQFWLQKQGVNYIKSDELGETISKFGALVSEVCAKTAVFDPDFLSHLRPYGVWTVRGDEGSFHKIHQHNARGSVLGLSAVTYLNVPSNNNDDEPNNNIYFVMNSSETTVFSPNKPNVVEISPKQGQLLIFPNWLLHGTYPQSSGLRQTFNVDYLVI